MTLIQKVTAVHPGERVSDVPVKQPLDALVSRFEEEVGAEAGEEERDTGIQLCVHVFGKDAAL